MTKNVVEGGHLMLFLKDTDNKYKSVGLALSHSLSISAETDEISTKDHGLFSSTSVKKISYEFSANHLYSDSFDDLYLLMSKKKPVSVVWGLKKEDDSKLVSEASDLNHWSPAQNSYQCSCLITSLSVNANSGERATFDIKLNGVSEFKKVANVEES